MAEQPVAATATNGTHDATPGASVKPLPKSLPNPALRMMGLPNFRLRLPSRNWLIFLSITGSFTTALLYDRYHKRKAQRRWCKVVSHLAEESLPTNQMPRTITIFLAPPPGDGLRAAREHFHEYVKPILVAGALDWEVIEGRREGEVRAGLAAKIRRIRRRSGENVENQDAEESVQDHLEDFRQGARIRNWDGIQGDLILGRHTWKEYIRGLHEGWIGPLEPPKLPEPKAFSDATPTEPPVFDMATSNQQPQQSTALATGSPDEASSNLISNEHPQDSDKTETESASQAEPTTQEPQKPPEKPATKTSPTPPYLVPAAYSTATLSAEAPSAFSPSTVLPFPHLLGFLNTPIRVYRFLNRRHLANETGRSVATLILASDTRTFDRRRDFFNSTGPEDAAPGFPASESVIEAPRTWEQENILLEEEGEWHKSAWAPNKEDLVDCERPWKEKMAIDERIGTRMRMFDLPIQEEEERVRNAEVAISAEDKGKEGRISSILRWLGLPKEEGLKGWEMGSRGNEDD